MSFMARLYTRENKTRNGFITQNGKDTQGRDSNGYLPCRKMKISKIYLSMEGRYEGGKTRFDYEAKWKWKLSEKKKSLCVAVKSNLKKTDYIIPFSLKSFSLFLVHEIQRLGSTDKNNSFSVPCLPPAFAFPLSQQMFEWVTLSPRFDLSFDSIKFLLHENNTRT